MFSSSDTKSAVIVLRPDPHVLLMRGTLGLRGSARFMGHYELPRYGGDTPD